MAYTPKKINNTTQIPEDITFSSGSGTNIPFGTTIPSVSDASTVTGLDTGAVQIVYDVASGSLKISPIGASTFTKTCTLV